MSARLNNMKAYGHEVDESDYDFVDDSVKQMIDFIWRPTQQSTSIGLLPVNEELVDTMAAEEVDNVETNQLVVAESEDKDVEEDEKKGEPTSVELEVKVSVKGGRRRRRDSACSSRVRD